MTSTTFLFGLMLGAAVGSVAIWLFVARGALAGLRSELARRIAAETELAGARATAEQQQKAHAERLAAYEQAEKRLGDTFDALSAKALQSNNQQFLNTATLHFDQVQTAARADLDQRRTAIDTLVKPISDTLQKVEAKIEQAERARSEAQGGLEQHLKLLVDSSAQLASETEGLRRALRAPNVRGRWGELQLRRVVEVAGMLEYCDFVTQESSAVDGVIRRPDMIIRMPNSRVVVVDSKVPLDHYLNAHECADEDQKGELRIQLSSSMGVKCECLSRRPQRCWRCCTPSHTDGATKRSREMRRRSRTLTIPAPGFGEKIQRSWSRSWRRPRTPQSRRGDRTRDQRARADRPACP